jgi:hypothetical protein
LTEEEIAADEIPFVGFHRRIGLHDHQSPARLDIVRAELDTVIGMSDIDELASWARDISRSPESRLLSGSKAIAILQNVGEQRQRRPRGLSVAQIEALTAGLNSKTWRDPEFFCCLLDPRGGPGPVPRETPLDNGRGLPSVP